MTSSSAAEFLRRLEQLHISVRAENGNLCVTAPNGALTSELRVEISACKPDLLRFLETTKLEETPPEDAIVRVSRDGPMPASFAQKSLWLFHQLRPDSSAYNIPGALRLCGNLDTPALTRSLTAIVQRHEALRTTFESRDGEPVLIIHQPKATALPVIDLTSLPANERSAALTRQIDEEAQRPFDLERGPLFRPRLWKLAEEEHVLQLNVHHAVFDGWSFDVLLCELATLYGGELKGSTAHLPDLPVQFSDFAAWQRKWIKSDSFLHHAAFWKEHLSGAPDLLELPTDRPRPAVPSNRGQHVRRALPTHLREQLRAMQRAEGATPFAILLTAFIVLLHRCTAQDELVVGVPVTNRTSVELEPLIGLFVNVVPIRTRVERDTSFRDLLRHVRDTALDVFTHQAMPFDKLVEVIHPGRNSSHTPIFQVLFAYEGAPTTPVTLPCLKWTELPAEIAASKYDLTLSVVERTAGTEVAIEFSTDLFDTGTVNHWLESYATLLEGAVLNPACKVAQLSLLSLAQRKEMLVEWNQTSWQLPDAACLHEIVEAQVDRSPDAVAVVADDGVLTYHELDTRANQLARHLRARGVVTDALVGVYLERSLDLIVAVLGIVKAGGAYVPLDPDYPADRIAFMIADAGMPVVITHQRLLTRLPALAAQIIALDRDRDLLAAELPARPRLVVNPEHLAYAIYTSGSTGQPKGTLIPHRAIAAYLASLLRAYPLTAADAVLQNTQFNFDPSVSEIFSALVSGARLVLPPAGSRLDVPALAGMIRRHQITTLYTVPSMLRLMLEEPEFASCAPPLRWVSCGGERLPGDLVARFHAQLSGALLVNSYGPTEATIISTVWECLPGNVTGPVPIGRPINHVRAYIVDERLAPVPVGVTGELLIGGACLARGYLNRPELTGERFQRDPFLSEEGARVYRTGDLARFRADGAIEFLGRRDRQVKLRGFRIELGEIEASLVRHPQVREGVVVLCASPVQGDRLVAYVVPPPGTTPEPASLRHDLSRTLAPHMVPATFVILDRLPLTANGKVDYRALPEPPQADSRSETETFAAPQTDTERQIAAVWEEILGVNRIGLHDDFFTLGGHSLLAMRAVSRLRQECGYEVALRNVFEAPTVARLAAEVEKNRTARLSHSRALAAGVTEMEEGSI